MMDTAKNDMTVRAKMIGFEKYRTVSLDVT